VVSTAVVLSVTNCRDPLEDDWVADRAPEAPSAVVLGYFVAGGGSFRMSRDRMGTQNGEGMVGDLHISHVPWYSNENPRTRSTCSLSAPSPNLGHR